MSSEKEKEAQASKIRRVHDVIFLTRLMVHQGMVNLQLELPLPAQGDGLMQHLL